MMREMTLSGQSVTLITSLTSNVVAIVAIAFAWWSTRATLKQQRTLALDDRKWQEQRVIYQDIAEWLAENHLLDWDRPPWNEPDSFEEWTSDPGAELEAKAPFVTESARKAITELHSAAIAENELARQARFVMNDAINHDRPFKDSAIADELDWRNLDDARRELHKLRTAWNCARSDLEEALNQVYGSR
jgi:hypothetical protein